MTEQAAFTLRGHNPDVLTCIANLSNDEVFTPPELANQMLDTLEQAWAESNGGASIWADREVTFLDPFTKSGVFLREITRRLTDGLESQIPDLEERVDHILTKQVFGIGITRLTSLLARRSVYCSKDATGEHSIAKSFDRDWGNIWFERTEHTWAGGKKKHDLLDPEGNPMIVDRRCRYCGAQEGRFDRGEMLEAHAYAFIHADDINARVAELFGADMQFDVIIGNPPYQMTGASGGSSDASIYHLFAEQAMLLEPRLLSMVIPSRWMAGGRGLDGFRERMLAERHLRSVVDYPDSSEAFPGVQIKGGVCHFLWESQFDGPTAVTQISHGMKRVQQPRDLSEFDVLLRDDRAVSILKKVLAHEEPSITEIVSRDTPFGVSSNFTDYVLDRDAGHDIEMYLISRAKRSTGWVSRSSLKKNSSLIDAWKVLVPEAYGAGEAFPHQILGKAIVAGPGSACTQSFLVVAPFESAQAAESFHSYYRTRFFRFLVSLRKITQHALRSTYTWVPIQSWDREWSDQDLQRKYGLTEDEVSYIESMIRPMELDNAAS